MIVDEIHTSLSPVYSQVFKNIKYSQVLGLTATEPSSEEAMKILNEVCPIIYKKTLKEIAKTEGIIANTTTFNLPIKLDRRDKAKYNLFNEQFQRATMQISMMKKDLLSDDVAFKEVLAKSVFDVANFFGRKKIKDLSPEFHGLQKASKAYWNAMTMRKWVCYSAESKIPTVLEILKKYPERKWILFNKSINFAELLSEKIPKSIVYHSKMKTEEREKVLQSFAESKSTILICVDALNAGLNVPDTDSAICISGVSTELVGVQQQGRIGRYIPGKNAIFINLYSQDTVEKSWLQSKTKNLPNVRWVESINQI